MAALVFVVAFLSAAGLLFLALDWLLRALFTDEQIDRFADRIFR